MSTTAKYLKYEETPILVDYAKNDSAGNQINTYYQQKITQDNKLPASNVSGLATVATTGSYNDLSGKPTIGDGTLTLTINGGYSQSFSANQTTNASFDITAEKLGLSQAMNFVGVSRTDPTSRDGATVDGVDSWHKGDIVIYKRGTEAGYEEYINTTGQNSASSAPNPNWELLGDADSYYVKVGSIDILEQPNSGNPYGEVIAYTSQYNGGFTASAGSNDYTSYNNGRIIVSGGNIDLPTVASGSTKTLATTDQLGSTYMVNNNLNSNFVIYTGAQSLTTAQTLQARNNIGAIGGVKIGNTALTPTDTVVTIPDAAANAAGIVTTTAQSFSGQKQFLNGLVAGNASDASADYATLSTSGLTIHDYISTTSYANTVYGIDGITLSDEDGDHNYQVTFPTQAGRLALESEISASAADNILDGSSSGTTITYAPYSATTATSTWVSNNNNAGKLYLGTVNPAKTTRLNYNGNLYAKELYVMKANGDAVQVLPLTASDVQIG